MRSAGHATSGGARPGITGCACGGRRTCLRRFRPTNPMVVVDSVRFPYLDGTGKVTTSTAGSRRTAQIVPTQATGNDDGGATTRIPFSGISPIGAGMRCRWRRRSGARCPGRHGRPLPLDPRYGYTEQIVVPGTRLARDEARKGSISRPAAATRYYATPQDLSHAGLGQRIRAGLAELLAEPWDYFPFNDRDFTSVAELMLVPGCSPGLFTKQFVEFAPSAG